MRKGKQPQKKVHLPDGWWPRLQDLCRSLWQASSVSGKRRSGRLDIYAFTRISRRSFDNARATNEMTEELFGRLAENIGYERREHLLRDLAPSVLASSDSVFPQPTASADNKQFERVQEATGKDGGDVSVSHSQPPIGGLLSSGVQKILIGLVIGLTVVSGSVLLLPLWSTGQSLDPRVACLPLESTSQADLAVHRALDTGTPVPLPPPDPTRPDPIIFTISDPDGGSVRSIWTTSQFSYEDAADPARPDDRSGPGGGRADDRLRVGGWGDTYLSLLKFPLPDNRPVRRAILRLVVLGDEPRARQTTMILRVVRDPWDVATGPSHRLWWRDCPRSEAFMRLPAPAAPESHYEINLTELYNLWAQGRISNQGILLEPEHIGSYGSNPEHYPHFSTFYSTRAIDPEKRPKLILTY